MVGSCMRDVRPQPDPCPCRPIRICIVDDHPVVRAALAQLLEVFDDVVVVGDAADAGAAIDLVAARRPDVVLVDLSMPVVDGVAATEALTAAVPGTRVLLLTAFADRERIDSALDAGAVGYVLKDADPIELEQAIRRAVRGESLNVAARA
jgi:DNA-binding NarL/FixJ family response regulator